MASLIFYAKEGIRILLYCYGMDLKHPLWEQTKLLPCYLYIVQL